MSSVRIYNIDMGARTREQLNGQKFYYLTIVGPNAADRTKCDAVCDCGNRVTIYYGNLLSQERPTKSCGCRSGRSAPVPVTPNERFGKLVALRPGGRKNNFPTWWVKCDCGKEFEVRGAALRAGNTKSCGCTRRVNCGKYDRTNTKRTQPKTPEDATHKVCPRCEENKPASEFYRTRSKLTGKLLFETNCKQCFPIVHREMLAQQNAEDPRAFWVKRTLAETRKRCASSGKTFSLTVEILNKMTDSGTCAYCGGDLVFKLPGNGEHAYVNNSASLDQIIAKGGYTEHNTTVCCFRCNHLKRDATFAELRKVADAVEALVLRRGLVYPTG